MIPISMQRQSVNHNEDIVEAQTQNREYMQNYATKSPTLLHDTGKTVNCYSKAATRNSVQKTTTMPQAHTEWVDTAKLSKNPNAWNMVGN